MKIHKFLKKPLWITLTSVFTVLFVALIVGGIIADSWKKTISDFLGVDTYRLETIESDEEIDAEYYKSKYVKKDGNGNVIYDVDAETGYKHQRYDNKSLKEDGEKLAYQVQREGTTILWNNATDSTVAGLPLASGSKLSIFGQSCHHLPTSGRGSGNARGPIATKFDDFLRDAGFEVNPTLWQFNVNQGLSPSVKPGQNNGYDIPYNYVFAPAWSKYTDAVKNSFAQYGDVAVILVTRVSGEYEDCWQTGANTVSGDYLGISAEEKQTIDEVVKLKKSGTFKKIVMLLNTATGVRFRDFKPYESDVDACVWIGQSGTVALREVCNVLNGTSIPSGHLPDTYAYDGQSSPAAVNSTTMQYSNIPSNHGLMAESTTANGNTLTYYWSRYLTYAEGIYVGYRYYETRYEDAVLGRNNATSTAGVTSGSNRWSYGEEVAFPFGYGVSYTTFEYSNFTLTKNAENGNYTASVEVTNTGENKGADAVQIYIQKPYTTYDERNKIEQAAVNLCGFAKTKELNANQSVTVEIEIEADAFKTYDSNFRETYIMEKGAYYLTAAQDSHDAVNNILAAKGKTPENTNGVMDGEGDTALVKKIDVANDDFDTFAKSSTDYEVINQFDDVDWTKTIYSTGNRFMYLSRKNWSGTYPQKVQLRFHDDMRYALSNETKMVENPTDEMPLFEQEHQFNLIEMQGLEYNHEFWDTLLNQLSLSDMVEMMGSAYHGNGPIEHIANPGEIVYDGPLGVRPNYEDTSGENYYPMSFPIAPLVAATFNAELANEVGTIKGEDVLHTGLTGIYGTGANIHRTAYGGRAYEYYSEDGYLSGIMCKEEIVGIQKSGSVVNIKHFLLNDQEDHRYGTAIWANEQSIREIYLEAFRPVVEDGDATGIMTSFNRLGTGWSGSHYGLLTEVLRNEWGFDGYVISDCPYQEYMNVVDGLAAGNDCILYELSATQKQPYYTAKDNATVAKLVRESAHRILYVIANSNAMNGITPNTRIIPITTWWQMTILGLQIGFGVLTAASATMLVLCFALKKNKEKITV